MHHFASKRFLIISLSCLLVGGIWLASAADAAAATYYVATTGSDSNSCAEARNASTPKRTINAGADCLSGGDTLLIQSGTYAEALNNSIPGGTSWSAPVTVAAAPGASVTLRPAGGGTIIQLTGASKRYIILDGLTLDGADVRDFGVGITYTTTPGPGPGSARDIRVTNVEIKNVRQTGFYVSTGSEHVVFSHGRVSRTGLSGSGHGFYWNASNGTVEYSTIFNNEKCGIQFYQSTGIPVDNQVFRHNVLYNNGLNPNADNRCLHSLWVGAGNNALVYNNIFYGRGTHILNGIVISSGASNARIYNNTIYGHGQYGIQIIGGSPTIRNNIVYGNLDGNIVGGSPVLSLNLTTNPQFINPSSGDFHLQSSSPAIDAGTTLPEVPCDFDGHTRPAGGAYDIGAFEHGSSPGSGCSPGPSGGGATPTPTAPPMPTPIPTPAVMLQATPTNLTFTGQSSYMLWSVQHATSCTASGGWSGAKSPTGGTEVLTPNMTSTYTLTCQGPGGSASASIVISVGASGECHRYRSGSAIPQGFGVPWDTNNPAVTLLKARCGGGGVTLELGDNNNLTYIYKQAYVARPGATSWAPITLLGSGMISNAWFPRTATAVISMTDSEQTQTSHYVGYVCQYRSNAWKCGCRDSLCAQSYWQIQQVRR